MSIIHQSPKDKELHVTVAEDVYANLLLKQKQLPQTPLLLLTLLSYKLLHSLNDSHPVLALVYNVMVTFHQLTTYQPMYETELQGGCLKYHSNFSTLNIKKKNIDFWVSEQLI
jgi:hypothetical protein